MMRRAYIFSAIATLALAGCDAIFEPEGSGPPPPRHLPPPPPLESYEDSSSTETVSADEPVVIETPDQSNEVAEADPAEATGQTTENTAVPIEIVRPKLNLASLNAVPCAANPAPESVTIAEAAGATEAPLTRGPLVQGQVVAGAISAATLAVERANFPGIAKLEPKRNLGGGARASGHCGATRIAENWFVTAAHCLDEPYDDTVLRIGYEELDKPVIRDVEASWSVCHAAYGGARGNYSNDIALIHVAPETIDDVQDVNLPVARMVSPTTLLSPVSAPTARMAGWGMTSPGGSLSNILLGTTVEVESVGPTQIRVNSIEGSGPCIGDSGGPLFIADEAGEPVLTGVLSGVEQIAGARACEGDYTSRYTNLQGYSTWINGLIEACAASPEQCQVATDETDSGDNDAG